MNKRTTPDESSLSADVLIANLDEENLAWVLTEKFDDFCATLAESRLESEALAQVRPALEWTYIYAVHKMAFLADRAGEVKWAEVAEQLEKMLRGKGRQPD